MAQQPRAYVLVNFSPSMAAYWADGESCRSGAKDRLREMSPSCAAIMLSRRRKTPSRVRWRPSAGGVTAGAADTLSCSICLGKWATSGQIRLEPSWSRLLPLDDVELR